MAVPLVVLADIRNTKHNLSSSGTSNSIYSLSEAQICIFCHTPHTGSAARQSAIWNRNAAPTTGFSASNASTLRGSNLPTTWAGLGTSSQRCLTCHDASVNVGDVARYANLSTGTMGGAQNIGGTWNGGLVNVRALYDTTNNGAYIDGNHPVGVALPTSAVTGMTAYQTAASVRNAGLKLYGTTDTVECGSCHEPHGVVTNQYFFLRIGNSGSALCLACHNL